MIRTGRTFLIAAFIIIIALFKVAVSKGQNNNLENETKWGVRFSGFVKNDFWFDTRQVFTTREDLFLFYPRNRQLDANGSDINKGMVFNFSAMTTRLLTDITAPDALGAKLSGLIEGDFSGVSNDDINGLRLRHAFLKLRWKNAELVIGQYWHPLFTTECVPMVISLNTGAPFQPFIRNPQVRLTGMFGSFRLEGTIITQRDNANDGPDGINSKYMRNAVMPNADLQLQFKSKHHSCGVGGDYKVLKPRLKNDSLRISSSTIGSFAFDAYYRFSNDKLTIKIKSIYGQNLTEHLMLGGYAVHSIDTASGEVTYTPTNHLFAWFNITYGKRILYSLFLGYAKNFGTSVTNTGTYYCRGNDIDYMYRIAQGISYIAQKLQLSFEAEYTVAAYGIPSIKDRVHDIKEIPNLRLLFTTFYYF